MRVKTSLGLLSFFLLGAAVASATIFGTVRGIVHDPHHRPIPGAEVTIRARMSRWSQTVQTSAEGEFQFQKISVGEYAVEARAQGFDALVQTVVVTSVSAPILHFPMTLETLTQEVKVSATPELVSPESSTTQTLVGREQIAQTPGADHTNSLAMITDFVPGAYIVHDQLHIRGGHQVSWLVDGVPVPNTNIATNVGPQFDPKDIDYLEVQRGGLSAEYGDRTYGVFNVVTRSGFERNNGGELVASYGSFNDTNDQISIGSHTQRFAYYASLNANRSDLGLMTPTSAVLHDLNSGVGGFASLIFNSSPADQLRLVTSIRNDHYQIPNDPDQQAIGIRDLDRERDAFVNFSWVHTAGRGLLLTVSPFYHFNRAAFDGGPGDTPFVLDADQASQYLGGQATLSAIAGKHNARVGFESFAQRSDSLLGLRATDGSTLALRHRAALWGNLEALFLEDHYKLTSWLALNGGVRLTRFSGSLTETNADPRVGVAIRVPKLGWVLRGHYGRAYQAPPLSTISGPLLQFALAQGFGFLPLRGERDEQRELGLTIPFRDWVIDVDNFRNGVRNYFDHDVIGSSNIFLPLTIERARIRGWEATARSPRLIRSVQLHLAYSRQYAQARGAVTGGLTSFSPPGPSYFFLDHDQRNTVSGVCSVQLPRRTWVAGHISYGSGFLEGNGPAHMPSHTTFDLSLGKSFGESWSLRLEALNVANRRYLLDSSNTFGGTHYVDPRKVAATLRYRFKY